MFEILLQADRALASGLLDQAEQAYWQLIELDDSNAIATAGLARVALLRGDKRLARTFADRALKVDPDNIAARKVVDELEGRGAGRTSEETGLHVQAAQSLEALGRRRRLSARGEDGGPAGPGKRAPEKAAAEAERAEKAAAADERAREAEAEATIEALAEDLEPSVPTPAQHARADPQSVAPPKRARSIDPFEQAEAAATIEAIDAADDPQADMEQAATTASGGSRAQKAELTAREAELAAAERESAAQAADSALPSRVSGAAAAAGAAAGASGAITPGGRAPARGRFPAAAKSPTSEDLDDELPDAVDSDEETSGRPIPIEAGAFGRDHSSEEDAEAAAMREAMELMARGEVGKDEPPDAQRKGLFRKFRGG